MVEDKIMFHVGNSLCLFNSAYQHYTTEDTDEENINYYGGYLPYTQYCRLLLQSTGGVTTCYIITLHIISPPVAEFVKMVTS